MCDAEAVRRAAGRKRREAGMGGVENQCLLVDGGGLAAPGDGKGSAANIVGKKEIHMSVNVVYPM